MNVIIISVRSRNLLEVDFFVWSQKLKNLACTCMISTIFITIHEKGNTLILLLLSVDCHNY